ncbi:FHA domain-containing protein [Cognatiyoonia sp. IB215182]|uniref:FHA domain-containing protein n=1 Tax=Cognatiyoonia sp. IB215182 TaxID=3097353 RepID=UPI002A117942|nr:EscD/YscD/HrpQ family type III secretion system periplasmic domain-containing protein [Cognatiyoonia sp. IB215182]MDX8355124.1 EscD/YscD/HrpQ family type III secretion system periplasmic domain-containing protein [Cognatiyoonia sp. IB215182]
MVDENAYVLKVLTGAQAGAEVSIAEAEYVLGSGPDDDLNFVDLSLKPGHARLQLENGLIKIAGGAGTVKTRSGKNILAGDETWQEIDALDIITIGTTSFAIGLPSADWSSIENLGPAQDSTKASNPPPIVTQPRWGLKQYATAFAIIGAVVLAAMWVANQPAGAGGTVQVVDDRPDLEIVNAAFSQFPFAANIAVSQEVDGVIEANGYVDTPAERRALRNAIDETGIPVRFRIWSRAIIENEVQAIVENQQIPVQFSVGSDGVLTLRGDVLDQTRVDRLVATLSESVAGVAEMDVQVQTANTYLTQIRALLGRSELQDTVIIRLDGTLIEANGIVVADKVDNWVGFIQSYARRYADRIALRSFVQLVDENGEVLANPVSAQPGLPVIIGSVEALQQGPLAGPAFSPLFQELEANTSSLPSNALLNNALNNRSNTAPAREGGDSDTTDGAIGQANDVGLILDLNRLKEGSFGAQDVFEGFNETALASANTAEEVVSNVAATASDAANAPEALTVQNAVILPQFLNHASRPESIRGTRVLYNMTKAVLSEETGVAAPPNYITELAQLGNVDATLAQMTYLWEPFLGSQDAQDAYLQMLVTPATDFTECWDNSITTVGNLPISLFWLDYLSVTDDVDISAIHIDAQVLLLEAALNPTRLTACAARLSERHNINLAALSLYLQEISLNPEFIRYMVRRVEAYPLALSGVNLGFQNRYVQLANGNRLNEGEAPVPSSLLLNVGELGVLVKERDQLSVTIYDSSLHWKSGG